MKTPVSVALRTKVKRAVVVVPVVLALGLGIAAVPGTGAITAAPATSVAGTAAGPNASSEQAGAAARAIIAAVKKLGSGAVNAMKAAVRSFAAFEKWFNGLPWYIRILKAGVPIWTLYETIRGLL